LWLALVPVLGIVFFASAERVHMAKAGQSADIAAKAASVSRAESELKEARDALRQAEPAEARAKAIKAEQCGINCRTALGTAQAARERVTQAEQALATRQSTAITESPFRAPVWLLPAVLDLVAFLGIWVGLSGPWVSQTQAERPNQQRKRSRKPAAKRTPAAPRKRVLTPANVNNIVPMTPAG
jgi:hypothetical protein